MSASSLRFDVTTGDWIVFAAARGQRPHEFALPSERPKASYDPNCPFCPGATLSTTLLDEEPDPADSSKWKVRVLANKYPALVTEQAFTRHNLGPLFREMSGHGAHEVIIESPDHAQPLALATNTDVTRLFEVLRRRCNVLTEHSAFEVVQLFENHGARAGASLHHPHFQILAAPVVPRQVRIKYQVAAEYYHATGSSVYADLCREELASGERLVFANADFAAFTPYASRVAYETWIVPRAGGSTFAGIAQESLAPLAEAVREVLRAMHGSLADPAYNLIVNSAPRRHADEPDFVWHIEILPRLSVAAGFELATGMAINSVLPEDAAASLRAARNAAANPPRAGESR